MSTEQEIFQQYRSELYAWATNRSGANYPQPPHSSAHGGSLRRIYQRAAMDVAEALVYDGNTRARDAYGRHVGAVNNNTGAFNRLNADGQWVAFDLDHAPALRKGEDPINAEQVYALNVTRAVNLTYEAVVSGRRPTAAQRAIGVEDYLGRSGISRAIVNHLGRTGMDPSLQSMTDAQRTTYEQQQAQQAQTRATQQREAEAHDALLARNPVTIAAEQLTTGSYAARRDAVLGILNTRQPGESDRQLQHRLLGESDNRMANGDDSYTDYRIAAAALSRASGIRRDERQRTRGIDDPATYVRERVDAARREPAPAAYQPQAGSTPAASETANATTLPAVALQNQPAGHSLEVALNELAPAPQHRTAAQALLTEAQGAAGRDPTTDQVLAHLWAHRGERGTPQNRNSMLAIGALYRMEQLDRMQADGLESTPAINWRDNAAYQGYLTRAATYARGLSDNDEQLVRSNDIDGAAVSATPTPANGGGSARYGRLGQEGRAQVVARSNGRYHEIDPVLQLKMENLQLSTGQRRGTDLSSADNLDGLIGPRTKDAIEQVLGREVTLPLDEATLQELNTALDQRLVAQGQGQTPAQGQGAGTGETPPQGDQPAQSGAKSDDGKSGSESTTPPSTTTSDVEALRAALGNHLTQAAGLSSNAVNAFAIARENPLALLMSDADLRPEIINNFREQLVAANISQTLVNQIMPTISVGADGSVRSPYIQALEVALGLANANDSLDARVRLLLDNEEANTVLARAFNNGVVTVGRSS